MIGKKLLNALMKAANENPNSIADKLKRRSLQAQLQRYLAGETREPRRTTFEPVAKHYGVPVDAFYNQELGELILENLSSGRKPMDGLTNSAKFPILQNSVQLADALDLIADRINAIENIDHRAIIAQRLQTLANAPDSMKARNAVLEALAWSDVVKVTRADKANHHQIPGNAIPRIANG